LDSDEVAGDGTKAFVMAAMEKILVGIVGMALVEGSKAMAIVLGEIVVDIGEAVVAFTANLREVRESRAGHLAASVELLVIGMGGAGEAQQANERRQRKALEDESHKNDAESEKDDHVALREGLAVVERFGQRDSGGESDNATHTGPANDKDLARTGHGVTL